MQMMEAHNLKTCGPFKSGSFSEGVSAVVITIDFPLTTALIWMLTWRHLAYWGKQATAVVSASIPLNQKFMKEIR